ncbi:MAG TPA: hypothetical protein V6C72_11365 [Chroococcales cyanobacterium]
MLKNPPDLLGWNVNKTYLKELQKKGIPVVPTFWLEQGEHTGLARLMTENRLEKAVVKPAIGLSTFGVTMVDRNAPENHPSNLVHEPTRVKLAELSGEQALMVQPYLESVQSYGERALVFIAGRYSHAVRKMAFQPLATAGHANEVLVQATDSELETARRAIAILPEAPLYARVDLVKGERGEELVMELELVEPSLYFSLYPAAVPVFADAAQGCLNN